MKRLFISFVVVSAALSGEQEQEDPFAPSNFDPAHDELEYNPDESIMWEDELLEFGAEQDNYIKWASISKIPYKGREDKILTIQFSVDEKEYLAAVNHPDLNRGVLLTIGTGLEVELFSFLRPSWIKEGKAHFYLKASSSKIENMYIGFIPESGTKRFLYRIDKSEVNR